MSAHAASKAVVTGRLQVVIADDHPLVRSGIRTEILRHADLDLCGEAADGDSALCLVQRYRPDVLVIDINMPGRQTVEVLQELKAQSPATRALVLTAYGDVDYVLQMLKAGATGYLLKDEDVAAIPVAIRAIARGDTWMSTGVMSTFVNYTVHGNVQQIAEPVLSAREIQVLRHLAEGKENTQIGEELSISERTVRFHLSNIYDKLGMRRAEVIAWGVRQGLCGR